MRLAFERVSKRFGDRLVIDDLTLELSGPGVVGLMGPSGSGKSTLLSMVAGTLAPDSGYVHVEPADAMVDWIFQSAPVLPKRTALENVLLGPRSQGVDEAVGRERAFRALERVDIAHLAGMKSFRLSGGERQRVAIARVLSKEPRMVLADEPTASLDTRSKERVCDALLELNATGAMVVIATHDEYVAQRCSRVLRLANGRVHSDG